MDRKPLTQADLKEFVSYNPKTGIFRWVKPPNLRTKIGAIAGRKSSGYIYITIDKTQYPAHRLAWLYVHGTFPEKGLDHIKGIRSDNRICKLRPATHQQNSLNKGKKINNTSGYKGVSWDKTANKWRAQAMINKKSYYLGAFKTPKLASNAYQKFAKKHHGEFFRHPTKQRVIK